MKQLLIKLLHAFLKNKYAKTKYYSFFYFLYLQGIKGMDHGYSYSYPENSGEFQLLKKISSYYGSKNQKIVFFDVGANTGYYAKKVKDVFNRSVTIYCFEPSTFTYEKLTSNLGDSIVANNFALSNRAGTATLHLDKDGSGMASLEDTEYSPPFGIPTSIAETVSVDTIDNFCSNHSILKIHFLKIDVEGHEYSVLEGAADKLKSGAIDFIQFEFGRVNIDSSTPLKKFYKLLHKDYNIYRILQSGLIAQFEYSYEYEIYLGTNFLAVNKLLDEDTNLKKIRSWG